MFTIYCKNRTSKKYKVFKVCRSYKNAYFRIGDWLQKNDTLHYSYSLKYMMDGYDRKRLFPYGTTYLRRKNLEFKIVESIKP